METRSVVVLLVFLFFLNKGLNGFATLAVYLEPHADLGGEA